MEIQNTPLNDVFLVKPRVFEDSRGYFFETYNSSKHAPTPLGRYNWVQDNESKSTRGVLRGMHFQIGDYSQAKLIRVIHGEVYDVALDLRQSSSTFKQWFGVKLNADNKLQMLIPRGFAHGFFFFRICHHNL